MSPVTGVPAALTAALYLRQSHGKQRSIDGQETDNRSVCDSSSWPVKQVYSDKVSASWFSSAGRPNWDRLLADLISPAREWNVLVIWESSRGDRTPETWLRFLRLCQAHAVLICVFTHERLYDVRKRRDWRTLADEGIDSADASWETSDRVLRGIRTSAAEGKPHSHVRYGYERLYDPATRELVEQRECPGQAAVVRDLFGWLDAGEAISVVQARLRERGTPSPAGHPEWPRSTIREIATSAAYIGKRSHITGRGGEPALYGAVWPAIVDEDLFWRVQRRLRDPARKTTRPGKARWLLSYIATCDLCQGRMTVDRAASYKCGRCRRVTIKREPLDGYVAELVIAWATEEVLPGIGRGDDAEVAAAQAEAARLAAELDQAARSHTRGGISLRAYEVMEADFTALIKAADKRAQEAGTHPAVRALLGEGDVRAAWKRMAVAAKRDAVRALMTITVGPATVPGGPQPLSALRDRVTITWKGQAA
jgi:DNA invertase Pin-like site-specific DNA recombinase